MTENEKQLILKDLCARLPHGVRVKQGDWEHTLESANMYNGSFDSSCAIPIPYLRPMSSMTEEEKEELKYAIELELQALEGEEGHSTVSAAPAAFEIDFYNKHHLDYRGLIEKGLALEALEGMYK